MQQLEDETKNLEAKNAQAVEKLRQLHHQHREELDKVVKETALEIQERCDRVKAERRSLREQLKSTQNELQTLKERAKLMEDASLRVKELMDYFNWIVEGKKIIREMTERVVNDVFQEKFDHPEAVRGRVEWASAMFMMNDHEAVGIHYYEDLLFVLGTLGKKVTPHSET